MEFNFKMRLLGYYTSPNQVMKPEEELVDDAKVLADLLGKSIDMLYQNPLVDDTMKSVITSRTVFVFKGEEDGHLYGYFTTDRIARISNVRYQKNFIKPVDLKYKRYFVPGEEIRLINDIADNVHDMQTGKHPRMTSSKVGYIAEETSKLNLQGAEYEDSVEKVKKRLRLKNNYFIGQFSPDKVKQGWYRISDIRDTGFTKVEDKERGVKNLTISFFSTEIQFNKYAYYKFSWKLIGLSPLKFGVDLKEDITPVYPRDIVTCLHDTIINYDAGSARLITGIFDTLNKQLTQSGKEVFIYELLQNANDYPRRDKTSRSAIPVDVEFHITDEFLTFQHSGEYFNPKNIAAICSINDGEKSANAEAIGYKGIGFKTVFLDNDYVYLSSGNYSFRFDKSATDVNNTPWQILPVWTELREIDATVRNIFSCHPNDEFRVKFALKPRDKRILLKNARSDNYIDLFSSVFDSERVILFIPNIRKVSVFLNDSSSPYIVREKNTDSWCVSDSMLADVPDFVRERVNEALTNQDAEISDGYDRIPEKYLNFYRTSVKFACKRSGRKLLPVDDAILYCYLPAKRADWGFKFLMNTDMVPNGPRDDIEDIELNHEIAKIAGRQFFFWIKQLIKSKAYDLDSIFALIPDFEECKNRRVYRQFIEEFQEEFEALIKTEAFVPAVDGNGSMVYKCISEIINDMTGITANSVMSDKDFLNLLELNGRHLPDNELRNSSFFNKFLYKHSPSELDIDIDTIVEKCESEAFQTWLSNVNNNTVFIKHLLKTDVLSKFSSKPIFIEYEGELFSADSIYYDFEENCKGLDFLRSYIPHLCSSTKEALKNEINWDTFSQKYFKPFVAKSMIVDYVIADDEAISLLKNIANSVAFYRYIAEKDVELKKEDSLKIPYMSENGNAITDYMNYRYFYSSDAYSLLQESWIGQNVINILSHLYFEGLEEVDKKRLVSIFANLGFVEFDKEVFITQIVAADSKFCANVNITLEKNYLASKAFIDYVYNSDTQLKDGSLKNYVLLCTDINGKKLYLNSDDVRYFDQEPYAQNSSYSDNVNHSWLTSNMMYALSNEYFSACDSEEAKKIESFLRQQFGVKTFTDKSFFLDVVIKNKTEIYDSLSETDEMLAFLRYLKRDAARIFDDTMSFNNIKDMPLLSHDGAIIKSREQHIQYLEFNEEAKSLFAKTWCPQMYVLLSSIYSDDFSQDMRQLFKIAKFDVNAVLGNILLSQDFIKSIGTLQNNVDFWRWIRTNQKNIDSFDQLKLLSIFDKDNVSTRCDTLYISDSYQSDKIESLVKKYVSSARFVTSVYLESESDTERLDWMKLFKKLGLKSDNKDILFADILPNLSSFEEDSVVSLMTKHLKDLKSDWVARKNQIMQLKVRTQSGAYLPINKVTIVNVNEEAVVEPFKYIAISNEVNPDILKANKDLLLLISNEYGNSNLISTKQAWIEAKVKEYLQLFSADMNSVADIHVAFVREIAKLQSEYKIDSNLCNQIKYRTKVAKDVYMNANELTLSSVYSPICDFEAYGVSGLSYLSNDYIYEGNKDVIKAYFKAQGLHQNMVREDLKYLDNRDFACYFWSYSFPRRLAEYETWIEEGCFKNLICVPTENSVQKPELLYSPHVAGYAVRAKSPMWVEKVPCKSVVDKIESRDARDLFEKLDFRKELSFEDCLYYLAGVNHNREEESRYRSIVINWMLSSVADYDERLVEMYRNMPTATWRNGKGQKKHISQLYAIHPAAIQEKNIFHGDEFVLQTTAFPNGTDAFLQVCDILKIKCLTSSDFIATPEGKKDETAEMVATLRPRLLVLSAIENPEKFQELYESYNAILSQYHFVVCDKIDLGYDTIHNDVERIYNDENHLYYVNSWKHNRTFTKFCSRLKRLIGFEVYDNVCEDVLDENISVENSIEKYCSALAYDDKFRSYLQSLDLTINVEIEDENACETDGEYYSAAADNPELCRDIETPDCESYGAISNTSESTNDGDSSEEDRSEVSFENWGQCHSGENVASESRKSIESTSDRANAPELEMSKATPSQYVKEEPIEDDAQEGECEENNGYAIDEEPVSIDETSTTTTSPRRGQVAKDADPNKLHGGYRGEWKPAAPSHPAVMQRQTYAGYSPDKFKERQFYPGEQDPITLSESKPQQLEIEHLNNLLGRASNANTIIDENYIARMRFYNSLKENGFDVGVDERTFIETSLERDVKVGGKYIHRCSARGGILYISPSVWNRLREGSWVVCFYSGKLADQFVYVRSQDELMSLINKDAVVVQVTGNNKRELIDRLYEDGFTKNMQGNIYTLIRTIKVEGEVTPFDENITDYYSDEENDNSDVL